MWYQDNSWNGQQPPPALSVMLSRALDMLDCALVVVNGEGLVEYTNRAAAAALRTGHGGLIVERGALTANRAPLREVLADAIRLACREMQPGGVCLSEPGVAPQHWLRLAVAPVYFGSTDQSAMRAAVWIVSGSPALVPSEQLLAALFGLTRAEARLAHGVLTGCTTSAYARRAGVGMATVRTQLHSIFVKTGVKRQAELVALLSRVPPLHLDAA